MRIVEEEPRREPRLYRVARVVRLDGAYPEAERARVARLRAAIVADVGVLVRATQPERARTPSTPSCSRASTTRPS